MKKDKYSVKREPNSGVMVKSYDEDDVFLIGKRHLRNTRNRNMSDDYINTRRCVSCTH